MATLIYNGDLTVLSSKIVKTLKNRSCGTEDIASRCCTTRDSVRQILHRLKKRELVEHDGRRPRTWKLKEQEAAEVQVPLLGSDFTTRSYAQNAGPRTRFGNLAPPTSGRTKKEPEAA